MNTTTIKTMSHKVAIVHSDTVVIKDVQTALDFMMSVQYETGCHRIVVNKAAICEALFDLRTKIAGEILQKFVTYDVKLAIIGDFSMYPSKSLRDFIYESNTGRHIFFYADEAQAIDLLGNVD